MRSRLPAGSAGQEAPSAVLTAKQKEARTLLRQHRHVMLYGGSRSGKTFLIVRQVFLRAALHPSRHLMVRLHFNSAKTSLALDTVPNVLARCFPGLLVDFNGVDNYWRVDSKGGESQVWLGGTDDKERVEKVLGNEYATIYINEASQVPWVAVPTLWTRLAQVTPMPQRCYYDCNPPGTKHWTHRLFMEGIYPNGEKHGEDVGHLRVNPADNVENLDPAYLEALARLPRRDRLRYLEGLYLQDIEGALWTHDMIVAARAKEPAPPRKRVVAVDPSVSSSKTSDECGIVVCGLDQAREGLVIHDGSGKLSTQAWAQRVVGLFHTYECAEVVAEVNQGGDLVADAIHNVDRNVPVVKVRAAVGKMARAEPIAQLYELRRVAHLKDMPKLEAELTETVFSDVAESPNRLDALVWGLTHLMRPGQTPRIHVG